MLAASDSDVLSRRMTEGRKLALLTALDGGCILKNLKNRIGMQHDLQG
jgi:hypothetical protein